MNFMKDFRKAAEQYNNFGGSNNQTKPNNNIDYIKELVRSCTYSEK